MVSSPPSARPWASRRVWPAMLLGSLLAARILATANQSFGSVAGHGQCARDFLWCASALLATHCAPKPNPSLKPSPNGGPPGPSAALVYLASAGPGVPPLGPA